MGGDRIRWVRDDDEKWRLGLHLVCESRLCDYGANRRQDSTCGRDWVGERVCQEHVCPLVVDERPALLLVERTELEMTDGIRRGQEFKAVQVRQEMLSDKRRHQRRA